MATFNETRASTYCRTRYSDAKLIKNISNVLFTLLCFCFRKQPKNLSFQSFLPLIDPLLATFSETCAPTSRKYVAEKGFNDAKSMGDM